MNALTAFNNPEFGEIRTVEIDGEPWLVGKDVALALGYTNPRKALDDHVDEEDKKQGDGVTIRDTMGREQRPTIINESGLYSLVLASKLPDAKKFRRWVTSDVLPSIRKHGLYAVDQLIENPDLAIQAFSALKKEREKRKALEAERDENRPKVLFADSVAASKTSILVGEMAKLLKQNGVDTGQNRLFDWMRNNGYLIRREGTDYNMPTQRAMEMGLFEIKETSITHADGHVTINKTPKVTGKGQQFFVNMFLK